MKGIILHMNYHNNYLRDTGLGKLGIVDRYIHIFVKNGCLTNYLLYKNKFAVTLSGWLLMNRIVYLMDVHPR